MEKLCGISRACASAATLLLAALLVAQTADAWLGGGYSRQIAAEKLASLAPAFWGWLASMAFSGGCSLASGARKRRASGGKTRLNGTEAAPKGAIFHMAKAGEVGRAARPENAPPAACRKPENVEEARSDRTESASNEGRVAAACRAEEGGGKARFRGTLGAKRARPTVYAPRPGRFRRAARWVLGAAALAFLALGAANGGAWDVLVKAINICTECIGLG